MDSGRGRGGPTSCFPPPVTPSMQETFDISMYRKFRHDILNTTPRWTDHDLEYLNPNLPLRRVRAGSAQHGSNPRKHGLQ